MAQIYGQLIRAQLQASAGDLTSPALGLIYMHATEGIKWYQNSAWKTVVDLSSAQTLSAKTFDATCSINGASLPIVSAAKGGLGADASGWTGVVKAAAGTFSAATIVNADVSATAAIDATKISSGGVTNTKFDKLSTAGANAPDTLVNTDGVQNLTNKTLLGCKVDNWSDFTEESSSQVAPGSGYLRIYAKNDHKLYKIWDGGTETEIGSGGGGGTLINVTQSSHGFSVGEVLYHNGTQYAKAIATAANTAEVVGIVSKVTDTNTFELTLSGEVSGLSGLTLGEVYFLSATTAGALTVTEPSTIGQVSVPVGVASASGAGTSKLLVAPKRGVVIGGVNARTEVALATSATTNVQDVSGMSAGELTGWVFVNSSPAKRFHIKAQFALSGAGGDYNLSYQTSGDVPPTGFLMDITTGGMIRVTLPAASGTTSSINYALNAPAIGASLPLTVNASNIQGRTSGTPSAGYVGETIRSSVTTSINAGAANSGSNITSITLTAGTWLVTGCANLLSNGATFNGDNDFSISTTSATVDASYGYQTLQLPAISSPATRSLGTTVPVPFSVSSSTTVYLVGLCRYSAGTPQWRGTIIATRIA